MLCTNEDLVPIETNHVQDREYQQLPLQHVAKRDLGSLFYGAWKKNSVRRSDKKPCGDQRSNFCHEIIWRFAC